LAQHFLQQSARSLEVEPKRLSEATQRLITTFEWKGNVRQLENLCHWLTVMAPGIVVEPADLPPELRSQPVAQTRSAEPWQESAAREIAQRLSQGEADLALSLVDQLERILITEALTHTRGKRIEAAQRLGWGRNTLTRKIHALGLDKLWGSAPD
jgi:two-component system nitrogen regulation response regulator GlnG